MSATVTEIGTTQTSSNVTSRVVTVGVGGIATGAVIVVNGVIAGNVTGRTIADTGVNTWTEVNGGLFASNSYRHILWTAPVTTTLNNGDTITVSWNEATDACMQVIAVTGLAASATDQIAHHANQASTLTPDTGTTGTLAQTDELVVACYAYQSNPSFSVPAGYSQTGLTTAVFASPDASASMAYLEVGATTALNPTCTLGSSVPASGGIVTMLVSVAGGTPKSGTDASNAGVDANTLTAAFSVVD